MAVALAVAATVAGVTLAATAATISERLLSSTRYREVAVTTTPWTAMEAPARKAITRRVGLSIENLERARSVTQAVQYAYLAEVAFSVLSLFLSAPLADLVLPIFHDVTEFELSGRVITPGAVSAGVAAALGIGGLMGTLPVFSALSAPIAEGIRD